MRTAKVQRRGGSAMAKRRRQQNNPWIVTLEPRPIPNALREICNLGQKERHFAVWIWRREIEERQRADLEEVLRDKGVSFSNLAYFGEKAENSQAATLRKRRLSMEKRGFYQMYPAAPTGRHTTHIRLTEKGRLAGEYYHRYGGYSPIQVENAISASVEADRKYLNSLNSCLATERELLSSAGKNGAGDFNSLLRKLNNWHVEALKVKEDAEKKMAEFRTFLDNASPDVAQQTIELVLSQGYWFPPPPVPEFTDGGTVDWPPPVEENEQPKEKVVN